jgi:hypothetical protein
MVDIMFSSFQIAISRPVRPAALYDLPQAVENTALVFLLASLKSTQ